MGVAGGRAPLLGELVRVRREVLEWSLHEAIDLGVVAASVLYGERSGDWVSDPWGFLERTYVTDGMRRAVKTVFAGLSAMPVLEGETGARVVVLPSLLGGGKTHLLAFLLYTLEILRREGPGSLERVDEEIARAARALVGAVEPGRIRIAVVAGDTERFAARPKKPVNLPGGARAETLWGQVLGQLGVPWEKWRVYDEERRVPGKDALRDMIGDGPALIVIDEITTYASSTGRTEEREMIVTFLKNLFEAASLLPRTVVVITLPASVRRGEEGLERVEHDVTVGGASFIHMVYAMAQRVAHKVIPPIDMEADIASVLRRRLLETGRGELERAARLVLEWMGRARSEELEAAVRELYGSWEAFAEKLAESFPFHPLYLQVLLDIGSHVPGFGRTRSLLKLTARILRDIDRLGASLVMPWHLDVEDRDTRAELLAEHERRDYYERVLREDLARLREVYEDPGKLELARKILAVVWLYSIALGALLNVEQMIRKAPSRTAIPAYILEPVLYSRGVTASDIVNVIEDLRADPGLNLAEIEGKLFYPVLPDVRSMLRRAFLATGEDDVYRELERLAREIARPGGRIRNVVAIARGLPPIVSEALRQLSKRETEPGLLVVLDPNLPAEELARELPRNNTFLLAPDYSVGVEGETRLVYITRRITRAYPFAGKPGTLWELISTIARLKTAAARAREEARHLGLDPAIERAIQERLSRSVAGLEQELTRALETALRTLYGGVRGKRRWQVDLEGLLSTYAGSGGGEPFEIVRALEGYMLNSLGLLDALDERALTLHARKMNKIRMETLLGETREIIAEPLSVRDLWRYLLESADPEVSPHLMSLESFAQGLARLYATESYASSASLPMIAFTLDTHHGERVVWLKPLNRESPEAQGCFTGMMNRFYKPEELLGEISRLRRAGYRSLGRALLETRIVHPMIVVESYIRGLLEDERPQRRDDVEVRRKYYLRKCSPTDTREELSKVYSLLRGNPGRLYEELAAGFIEYEEVVVEKSYTAAIELPEGDHRYTAGSRASLRVVARVESSDYPAPVEVIARISDTATGRTLEELTVVKTANMGRSRRFQETIVLEVPVPREPGRYVVDLYTRGLHPSDMQEIHHASLTISVEGEKCAKLNTVPEAIQEAVRDADKWSITGVRVELGPGAPPIAYKRDLQLLIRNLAKLQPRIRVEAAIRRGEGTLQVRGESLDYKAAGRIIQTIADLIDDPRTARLEKLTLEATLGAKPPSLDALGLPKTLAGNTTLEILKCIRVV